MSIDGNLLGELCAWGNFCCLLFDVHLCSLIIIFIERHESARLIKLHMREDLGCVPND